MPVVTTFPSSPVIDVTMATPGNPVASEFDPLGFTVGDFLFVRNQGTNGVLYKCLLDGANVRFWFQIGGGTPVLTGAYLTPMKFAGGLAGDNAATVTRFLADAAANTGATAALRFPRVVPSGVNLRATMLRLSVGANTLTTNVTVDLFRNGVIAAPAIQAVVTPGGPFPKAVDSNVTAVTINSLDTLDVRITNAAGGTGNSVLLTAMLEFTTV